MSELTKIKDVTTRYGLTARTLRYYQDIGLLTSVRDENNDHRMYDEAAITRLQQILILRKLNISIKDIKQIFETPGSDAVLAILGKRADDIDGEIGLLHELREIILDFVRQIKNADFHDENEVKKLYDKAQSLEIQLATNDYSGNTSNANRLFEVAEKLEDKRITTPIAIKTYKQSVPPMRFIGKKYPSGGEAWKEWDENSYAQMLKAELGDVYEDGSLIGLMCQLNGFEYWLGYFTAASTPVPDGFEYTDFPARDIVTGWLYGKEDEVFAVESIAYEKLLAEGFAPIDDWWFERYHPVRTVPDKKGYMIIDICFFANTAFDAKSLEPFKPKVDALEYGEPHTIALETMVAGINRSDINGAAGQHAKMENGELVITAQGDLDCMQTVEQFPLPLRIDAVVKAGGTDEGSIRMYYHAGTANFNWEEHLFLCDTVSGVPSIHPGFGRVSADEYHCMTWIIHREFAAILINDELRYAAPQEIKQPVTDNVRIGTAWGGTIAVKSLAVTPIYQGSRK